MSSPRTGRCVPLPAAIPFPSPRGISGWRLRAGAGGLRLLGVRWLFLSLLYASSVIPRESIPGNSHSPLISHRESRSRDQSDEASALLNVLECRTLAGQRVPRELTPWCAHGPSSQDLLVGKGEPPHPLHRGGPWRWAEAAASVGRERGAVEVRRVDRHEGCPEATFPIRPPSRPHDTRHPISGCWSKARRRGSDAFFSLEVLMIKGAWEAHSWCPRSAFARQAA